MNSRAPELTLLTVAVNPQALVWFTITPSTPMNIALRNILPKFWGSVT
jgi:hypothetical protein